jgi:hypothetical protein
MQLAQAFAPVAHGCQYCGPMRDVLVIAPGLSLPPMSAAVMVKAVQASG